MSNEILDALKGDEEQVSEVVAEPKVDPIDDKIKALAEATHNSQNMISQLTGKIDAVTNMVASKPEPEDDFDDSDELTPKQALETARKERKEEREQDKDSAEQTRWDNKTDSDFGSFGFTDKSSKFYREVHAEYTRNGNKKSPTSVYDAASRVFANGVREGWIKPNQLEDAKRNHQIANGTLEAGTPRASKKAKEITETQDFFGTKLGFTKDKVKEIYGRQN